MRDAMLRNTKMVRKITKCESDSIELTKPFVVYHSVVSILTQNKTYTDAALNISLSRLTYNRANANV